MSFLKLSTDGTNGSGKTCTMAQLAVGIAKEYADSGPVHVFDSSDRWPSWKIHIFDREKVPLVITAGDSISALLESLKKFRADRRASVLIADDLTVPWTSGIAAFSYGNGLLPFERRQQLVNEWNKYVRPFQTGEFHAIACGRLGYHWTNVEDPDSGDMKLVQGDSKFNAGGSQNFGYDCNLECEMRRRKRRVGLLRSKTVMEYICDVVKDADSVLSNEQFVFEGKNFRTDYRAGGYAAVLDKFRPHLDFRIKLAQPDRPEVSDSDLIVSGKTEWAHDQSARRGFLEEIDKLIDCCFPGGEKVSKLHAMFRNVTLEFLNGYMSWSRMEEEVPTLKLRDHVRILKKLRERLDAEGRPTDQSALSAALRLAKQDFEKSDRDVSLLDAMAGRKSVQQAPITPSLDAWGSAAVGD